MSQREGTDRGAPGARGEVSALDAEWLTGREVERLAIDAAPDPFQVQPGGIVADRFCVIGRVRHAAEGWRVPVTDLTRRAGTPPHHRLVLHRLVADPERDRGAGVSAAIAAHQRDARRIVATSRLSDGLLLVSTPADGPALRLPLTDPEASAVVRALAGAVRELHRQGWSGLRYDLRELRLDGGRVQFGAWRHLLSIAPATPESRAEDVAALAATFRGLGTRRVTAMLDDRDPSRPAEALDRWLHACAPAAQPTDEVLPTEPPFVGREDALARLSTLTDEARDGSPGWVWVSGPSGVGRSRLLAQAAAESITEDRLAVHVAFRAGMPATGLGLLLDELAAVVGRLSPTEREQLTTRVRRTVGAQLPVVRQASPRLADLLGDADRSIVDIPLQERFLRHAAALADLLAAIGTPERVLVLLLDDVQASDAGVRAVLWNLLSPGRRHHTLIVVTSPSTPRTASTPGPVTDPGPLVLAARAPEHLALAPFTPGEVDRWTRALFATDGAETVSWALYQETDGVPAALWDRVRGWADAKALEVRPGGGVWLRPVDPPATASAPRSDDARHVGACCAVRAEHVGPFWLTEVTGWPATRIHAAVGELTRQGALVQHESGALAWREERERQRFVDAEPAAVRAAHEVVARWLEVVDPVATVVQRAWHLEHARAPGPDEGLARLHFDAGTAQLAHANVERAAWHFARVADRSAEPTLLRRARRGFADAELLQNHVDSALAAYLDAMERSEPAEALDLANEAVTALYLRGCDSAIVSLADASLRRVGRRLPRGWLGAGLQVAWALVGWGLRAALRRPVVDPLADAVATLYTLLVPAVSVTYPWVALTAMVRAAAVTALRTTGPAARARAFLAPVVSAASGPRALSLLSTAERDARGDEVNHAIVLHLRGQTELTLGLYAEGQASLSKAVAEFRQAGDLSIGVISMAVAIFYAIDRDPSRVLVERLDQALATAWRQRNQAILKNLQSMRIWARTRAGELRGDRIDREIASLVPGDPVQDLIGDAMLAMALLHDDRPAEALERARAALDARERLFAKPPFLDGIGVPAVLALVALGKSDEAVVALGALQRTAGRNPTLRVALEMCRARVDVSRGRVDEAMATLRDVIAQASVHGERWHVLAAHRQMAELLAGREPGSVAAHRSLAAELARALQERGAVPEEPAAPPPLPPPPPAEDAIDVQWLLASLRATLVPALPGGVPLEVGCTAGVPVPEPRDVFELLVVNLVLAARDGAPRALSYRLWAEEEELDAERAAALVDGTPGRWLALGISVAGAPLQIPRGAVRECRDLGAALGGFLHVQGDSAIVLYLPSTDRRAASPAPVERLAPRGTAAVLCADERLARTLVSELVRLGWAAVPMAVGDALPPEATVLLAEGALADEITLATARLVTVLPRSAPAQPGTLRVPFVVGELEALLHER